MQRNNMTQQERDNLREKHRRDGVLGCWTCQDYLWNDEYPCDVIKVLDAWERTLMKATPECEHYDKVIASAPTKPDELDEPASDRYKGYYEGWWDCLESLRIVSSDHTESNEYRLQRYAR
jgi:hypothetical protein